MTQSLPPPAPSLLPESAPFTAEQRAWRTMTRSKLQLVRDRVRLQSDARGFATDYR